MHLSGDMNDKLQTIFGAVLPGVGILAGPVGLIFDKFGENVALFLLIILSSVSSVCGMLVTAPPNVFAGLQIVRIFVFSLYYPMIYGVWAFFLVAKFGTTNFGVLYAIIATMAGLVNVTASNPLINFATKQNSFFEANTILLSIGGVFALYPLIQLLRKSIRRRSSVGGSGYYEPKRYLSSNSKAHYESIN